MKPFARIILVSSLAREEGMGEVATKNTKEQRKERDYEMLLVW